MSTIFSASRVEEVRWEVVIDGQKINISDRYMEELVRRYLFSKRLKVVDFEGKPVEIKGMFR